MLPSFHHSPSFLVVLLLLLLLATCSSLFTSRRCLLVHALASTTTASPPPLVVVPRRPLRFFIGGLGYCGTRLAERLRLEFGPDCHISGSVRSEASKQRLLLSLAAASSAATTGRRRHDNHDLAIHILDLDQDYQGLDETGLDDLQRATHIIQTIAPIADLDRDPLLALHSQTLLRGAAAKQGALAASSCSSSLQWVGYLSSTGVYGDHGGDWVDEDSDLKCHDAKSLARVQAEQEWRDFETTMRKRRQQEDSRLRVLGAVSVDDDIPPPVPPLLRVDCFRCGGIYGPGRGPLATALARLDAGTLSSSAMMPEEEDDERRNETPKYVNRILVDDICGAIVAAVKGNMKNNNNAANAEYRSAASGSIYNLVDDDPAPRRHVVEEANRLVFSTLRNQIKLQTPSSSSSSKSSLKGALSQSSSVTRPTSRSTGNKRCKNHRLKDAFHWTLLAPTYREGLRICLELYENTEK